MVNDQLITALVPIIIPILGQMNFINCTDIRTVLVSMIPQVNYMAKKLRQYFDSSEVAMNYGVFLFMLFSILH